MPSTKTMQFFLDERLHMFKIKFKSNLQVVGINKKCKYYTRDMTM